MKNNRSNNEAVLVAITIIVGVLMVIVSSIGIISGVVGLGILGIIIGAIMATLGISVINE